MIREMGEKEVVRMMTLILENNKKIFKFQVMIKEKEKTRKSKKKRKKGDEEERVQ